MTWYPDPPRPAGQPPSLRHHPGPLRLPGPAFPQDPLQAHDTPALRPADRRHHRRQSRRLIHLLSESASSFASRMSPGSCAIRRQSRAAAPSPTRATSRPTARPRSQAQFRFATLDDNRLAPTGDSTQPALPDRQRPQQHDRQRGCRLGRATSPSIPHLRISASAF